VINRLIVYILAISIISAYNGDCENTGPLAIMGDTPAQTDLWKTENKAFCDSIFLILVLHYESGAR